MAKTEEQYRQDILDVGKLIYQKGWVAANDGNISVRLDDQRILCTCTGVSKGMMTPADVIVCDVEGNKIAVLHQYKRTDGSIGGSGQPDPKMLLIGQTIYFV